MGGASSSLPAADRQRLRELPEAKARRALDTACDRGELAQVRELLGHPGVARAAPADPDNASEVFQHPPTQALYNLVRLPDTRVLPNRYRAARLLLEARADPNAIDPEDSRRGVLSEAAAHSTSEMVKLLLAVGGAQVDHPRFKGRVTPLVAAAHLGELENLKLLLKARADPNASTGPYAGPWGSALSCAAARAFDSREASEMLLKAGADPNLMGGEALRLPFLVACGQGKSSTAELLRPLTKDAEEQLARHGPELLLRAFRELNKDAMRLLLLEAGVDPAECRDSDGRTLLELARARAQELQDPRLEGGVEQLLLDGPRKPLQAGPPGVPQDSQEANLPGSAS